MDAVGQKEEQDEDLKAGFWGLKEYVDNSGDIIITSQSLAVPEERREGFYRLVENAQKGIARHVLGDLADKGERLAERCARRQEQLIEGTDLKGFHLPRTLESFMADPMLTMAKPAFGIILEGLQKELSFKEMEEQAGKVVSDNGDGINHEALSNVLDIRDKVSKEACEKIDNIFGVGASKKIFGSIIPDMYSIAEFFEKISPFIEKYAKERNQTINRKYSKGRKGSKS